MQATMSPTRADSDSRARRITVVSPVFGGAFPIALAAGDALSSLGHDVAFLDMRVFAGAYRTAAAARSEEAQRAFFEQTQHHILHTVQHHRSDLLLALALAPIRAPLLQTLREAGVTTTLWHVEHHQRFNAWRPVAAHYDLFLRIQEEPFASALSDLGVRHHAYLPLAASPPASGADCPAAPRTPLVFFGSPYRNRIDLLTPLADLGLGLWGLGWADVQGPLRRCVRVGDRYLDAQIEAEVYASADIVLNPHSTQPAENTRDFVNPRLFMLAARGHFQLTDARSLLQRHFAAEDMVTYDSPRDLRQKIGYYLARPEARMRIAAAAQRRALSEHTYAKRMATLLQRVRDVECEGQRAALQHPGAATPSPRAEPRAL